MYLHACAAYPIVKTWIAVIEKGNYFSWPNLSAIQRPTWVKNNLPKRLATTMGHMKAVRQGTETTKISTGSTITSVDDNEDSNVPLETPRSHIELSKDHQKCIHSY